MSVSLIWSDWGDSGCETDPGFEGFPDDVNWSITIPGGTLVAGDLIVATTRFALTSGGIPLGNPYKISDGTETALWFQGFNLPLDVNWAAVFRADGGFGAASSRVPTLSGDYQTETYADASGDYLRVQLWRLYEYEAIGIDDPIGGSAYSLTITGATTVSTGVQNLFCSSDFDNTLEGAAMSYRVGGSGVITGEVTSPTLRDPPFNGWLSPAEYSWPVTLEEEQKAYWGILAG